MGFPAWYYGPAGEAAIFDSPDCVPDGWRDHPFGPAEPVDRDGHGAAGGVLPNNLFKLRAIARRERIDLRGARTFAAVKATIEAARAAAVGG